jgi:hypothetical protein
MSDLTQSNFLLIGLPSTGKTSFLAALWYAVNQSSIHSGLTLDKLDGDSQYLNQIRDAWVEYRPVPRNKADSQNLTSMRLINRETNQAGTVSFPDLSGEAFKSQWTQRQLATTYDKCLRQASGGILFVNPDKVIKPQRIDTVNAVLAGMDEDTGKQKTQADDQPWDSEKSPTQVQLVDILQFMTPRGHFQSPFRLAIVVSAWDRLQSTGRRPADWVATELPLLSQFIDSNPELFSVAFYGISAQGGRYALPHFSSANFDNSQSLAERICGHNDPISQWIWSKLDSDGQLVLELIRTGSDTTELQRKALANDFNRVMAEPDLYDNVRFGNINLRPETAGFLRNGILQNEEKRLYLVRLLLEDAYPTELSREREYADEASNLQEKTPAARVLVVGDGVGKPHDVTEPIQWLMR